MESEPGDVKAKYHLAYVLLIQHQQDQALTLLTAVVRDKPDYAEAQYQLGKILLERGEIKAAIERLETAVRLDPGKDYSSFQLSTAHPRHAPFTDPQHALHADQNLQ